MSEIAGGGVQSIFETTSNETSDRKLGDNLLMRSIYHFSDTATNAQRRC